VAVARSPRANGEHPSLGFSPGHISSLQEHYRASEPTRARIVGKAIVPEVVTKVSTVTEAGKSSAVLRAPM
jgi:hypothetical protein